MRGSNSFFSSRQVLSAGWKPGKSQGGTPPGGVGFVGGSAVDVGPAALDGRKSVDGVARWSERGKRRTEVETDNEGGKIRGGFFKNRRRNRVKGREGDDQGRLGGVRRATLLGGELARRRPPGSSRRRFRGCLEDVHLLDREERGVDKGGGEKSSGRDGVVRVDVEGGAAKALANCFCNTQ